MLSDGRQWPNRVNAAKTDADPSRRTTRMVAPLHQLLLELIPGGAKKDLSARQARRCWPACALAMRRWSRKEAP